MPSLPYGRGPRFDKRDAPANRNESIAVRRAVEDNKYAGIIGFGGPSFAAYSASHAAIVERDILRIVPYGYTDRDISITDAWLSASVAGTNTQVLGMYVASIGMRKRMLRLLGPTDITITIAGTGTLSFALRETVLIPKRTMCYAAWIYPLTAAAGTDPTTIAIPCVNMLFSARSMPWVLPRMPPEIDLSLTTADTTGEFPFVSFGSPDVRGVI